MKKKRLNNSHSLKVNIIFNLLYELLVVFTPFITAPYVSRVLQPEGVGINSYTNSLLMYFTLFAALGTGSYGKKIISGLRDKIELYSEAFWEIEIISILMGSIFLVLWILFSLFYKQYRPYMLILSFTLLATLFDISWLYGGLEKFQYIVGINSVFKIISVIAIFLFVKTEDDVLKYTAIISLSMLSGSISMWLFLPQYVIRTNIKFSSLIKHFKGTIQYFVPSIATSIYTILDKTLIGIITDSNSQNGYYEQATKIINIIKSVCFNAINGVIMARVSYLYTQNDEKELKKIKDKSFDLISFLSVGACFGIIGISSVFVPLFFGDEYGPVIILLKILAIAIVIICLSSVANTTYYLPCDKIHKAAKRLMFGAGINILLNFLMIPFLHSYGAAAATLISESIITFLFVNGTNGFIKWSDIWQIMWKKICAGLVMLLALVMLQNIFIELSKIILLCTEILIGGIVYILSLTLLKDISIMIAIKIVKNKFKKGKNV